MRIAILGSGNMGAALVELAYNQGRRSEVGVRLFRPQRNRGARRD